MAIMLAIVPVIWTALAFGIAPMDIPRQSINGLGWLATTIGLAIDDGISGERLVVIIFVALLLVAAVIIIAYFKAMILLTTLAFSLVCGHYRRPTVP